MPPAKRRRTSTAPNASNKTRQQAQLSFRSTKSGIRKPESIPSKLQKSEDGAPVKDVKTQEDPAVADPEIETRVPHEPATEEIPGENQTDTEEDEDVGVLHREALKLSESKLKAYWASKEGERKAPRVHQERLSVHEKILREFDMSSRFGPGVGIRRSDRWHRAHDLGMKPPLEVLAVLLKAEIGNEKKSANTKHDVQTSIIDELTLSSRLKGDTVVDA